MKTLELSFTRIEMKKILLFTFIPLSLMAYQQGNAKPAHLNHHQKELTTIAGDYVTDGYQKRKKGYDWFVISVSDTAQDAIKVSVRSRHDLKKPTCTLDTVLHKASDGRYPFWVKNNPVYFRFTNNALFIEGEKDNLKNTGLFCSGGATLSGRYKKLKSKLDTRQLDKSQYATTITYGNFFTRIISTSDNHGGYLLHIQPMGKEEIKTHIDAPVIGADVGDINGDGHYEILVFTQSVGSGSYGNVIAYSSNNGRSWSEVYFPELEGDLQKGYMGHDEFALIENVLVRRFPLYLDGDTNAKPQGKTRQIQYQMKDGEASRQFVVDKVDEF